MVSWVLHFFLKGVEIDHDCGQKSTSKRLWQLDFGSFHGNNFTMYIKKSNNPTNFDPLKKELHNLTKLPLKVKKYGTATVIFSISSKLG